MHLGIDLGGTKIEIIALDSESKELYRHRIPSPQGQYTDTLNAIIKLVEDTESKLNTKGTIGIGIPGALSPETGYIKNANSTWLIGHDLKGDLSKALSRNIAIANDADCFTLSEATDGAAQNARSVFGIILGTGVGGGIVIENRLLNGPNAICGEWGHNPLPWISKDDPAHECYCGKQGCIETFLSGPGMLRQYTSICPNESIQSTEELIEKMRLGEFEAKAYFERYLERLGKALASIINVLDPNIIVFGGGLSNVNEIYPLINQYVSRYIFSDTVNTKFFKAKHGDSSGVRGAAWLGAQQRK